MTCQLLAKFAWIPVPAYLTTLANRPALEGTLLGRRSILIPKHSRAMHWMSDTDLQSDEARTRCHFREVPSTDNLCTHDTRWLFGRTYHAFWDETKGYPKPNDGRPVYAGLRPDFVWPKGA